MSSPTVKRVTTASQTPTSKSKGVIGRIKPMSFDDQPKINMMLYGRSGTGKTTLWGSMPGKILAVVCSGTSKPGELRSIDTPANRKRVSQVVVSKPEDLEEVTDHLKTNPGEFDAVVLDHVTGYADLVLKDILQLDELPVQKSFGMASREQYGQQALILKTQLRKLLDCPQTVVIVGQERQFGGGDGEDGASGTEGIQAHVGCALSPSVTGWLNTAVDYICRTFIRQKVKVTKVKKQDGTVKEVKTQTDEAEYCLRVGPSAVYQTKFRMPGGMKVDVVADPTFSKLVSLIRNQPQPTE